LDAKIWISCGAIKYIDIHQSDNRQYADWRLAWNIEIGLVCYGFPKPDSIISGPVYASLIPVIGRNSSDSNAVRKLFLSAISTISVIIFPISVGMSLTADFSIPLILGEKWPPSVKLLEILAVASGANCLAMAVGVCLLAIGHSRAQMALTGYLTAASVVAVPLGLPWGTPGVAVAILIASLSAWPFYLYTAKQKFGTSVIEILSRGRIPAIAIMPWRSLLLSAEKLLLSGWID
jgi:O-antigen/teichoic acid export membrane protein